MEQKDFSIITCKQCGQSKKRINMGKYANGKDIRWCDETGKQFNGLTCPDCHKNKVKNKKRLKSAIIKTIQND
jgi:hypothetical protein